jgi:hypothetical protein
MINYSIYVIEIMHQNDDLDFATTLQRFRIGSPTSHDVGSINSKLIQFNNAPSTSNILRTAFNRSCSKILAIQSSSTPLQFHALVTKRRRSTFSASKRRSLNNLSDKKTSHLPMILEVIIGCL